MRDFAVVVVEADNDIPKMIIPDTLKRITDASVTYDLVELDEETTTEEGDAGMSITAVIAQVRRETSPGRNSVWNARKAAHNSANTSI